MKTTPVAVAGGGAFVNVRATIPAHHVRIINADESATDALEYELADDNFATTYTMPALRPIDLIGAGHQGILQPPPGYFAESQPALGGIYAKVRIKGGGAGTLKLIESMVPIYESLA